MTHFPAAVSVLAVFCACLAALAWQGNKYSNADWGHPALNVLAGINVWFCQAFHRLPDQPIRLPESGPFILLSNHISGLDPLLLLAASNRPLRFLIAQEEYDRWWLKWLLKLMGCIPVRRDRNPRKALSQSLAALERGEVLVVFPQGGIVTDVNDSTLKQGAFLLARLSGAPVTAVRVEGVKGRGLTIMAVFMRSTSRIIQQSDIYHVTSENLSQVMAGAKVFLEDGQI